MADTPGVTNAAPQNSGSGSSTKKSKKKKKARAAAAATEAAAAATATPAAAAAEPETPHEPAGTGGEEKVDEMQPRGSFDITGESDASATDTTINDHNATTEELPTITEPAATSQISPPNPTPNGDGRDAGPITR